MNARLREWGSVGFRSPMTHREPSWMQDLAVEWDSSFFDTDPFEPMPGGVMTVWPYLMGRFVELPYTLPQDHTLIETLGETSPRIWLEKLDFLAANGGMALVNTPSGLPVPRQDGAVRGVPRRGGAPPAGLARSAARGRRLGARAVGGSSGGRSAPGRRAAARFPAPRALRRPGDRRLRPARGRPRRAPRRMTAAAMPPPPDPRSAGGGVRERCACTSAEPPPRPTRTCRGAVRGVRVAASEVERVVALGASVDHGVPVDEVAGPLVRQARVLSPSWPPAPCCAPGRRPPPASRRRPTPSPRSPVRRDQALLQQVEEAARLLAGTPWRRRVSVCSRSKVASSAGLRPRTTRTPLRTAWLR